MLFKLTFVGIDIDEDFVVQELATEGTSCSVHMGATPQGKVRCSIVVYESTRSKTTIGLSQWCSFIERREAAIRAILENCKGYLEYVISPVSQIPSLLIEDEYVQRLARVNLGIWIQHQYFIKRPLTQGQYEMEGANELKFPLPVFYSRADEDAFFESIYKLNAVKNVRGESNWILLNLDKKGLEYDEVIRLISLLKRYDLDLAAIKPYLTKRNSVLLRKQPEAYWYQKLFE